MQQSTDTLNMEDRKEEFQQSPLTMNLVTNGSVDFRGRIADKQKTGGWNSAPFIIVNEVAERLAFYAIGVNLVIYLVMEMRESIPTAAVHVTAWMGSAYVFTLLGAFMADAYLGRFKTILVFSTIYSVGMVLLTLSAAIDALRPPPCTAKPCTEITSGQRGFLFLSLGLVAIGTGGIKPCVSSFGADQFDEADEKEMQKKYAFFNWFFFAINMGIILGITVMVYIQDKKGWVWGFGVPTASMICSIIILAMGTTHYRYQKPMGSPFTRFFQVFVASVRNHYRGVQVGKEDELFEVKTLGSDIVGARKLAHTDQYRFLDKAAVITDPEENTKSRWKLCTVTQVEELKSFIRMLPIWATTIALSISFAQLSTFFISQATIMDRTLGSNFVIPPGSTPIFSAVNALFLIPIYEKWIVPLLRKRTGHRRGITSLQRMGVGLFISIFAMISAAVVEKKRRESPNASAMSVFWLFPQNFLIGSAEVFTYVGQLEFFYDEATEGTRSISSAIMLTEIGIGSWLSTAIVKIIGRATGGEDRGWLRRDLNKSKLDYLYWILTAINVFNFCLYVWVACRHKGKNIVEGGVRQEPASEKVGRGKKEEAGEDEEFQNMKL
ncbi:protein NRT1/ PTR FAMILY 8.1-like [Carica papaya]|uniref:protein NRT1/ PTR FAMILY 8.1-like n=1 Tax=Carica papaya TaxID=3649 RepID=UPI000B8CF4D9|nr:protein NRT1/ PTR FAMILY 8.1-like [Carica papaya]XP_021892803.1 protein NRT1/ PTR FAMILY 8.1-like [Carica papaya]